MECRAENYNVLSNPDRLHDNNIRAFADDSLLSTGWYRFGGMSQQLQEGLPNDPDMFLPNVCIHISNKLTNSVIILSSSGA